MTDTLTEPQQQTMFVCPECGREFERANALGAHRSRVHGIKGTSRLGRKPRSRSRVRPIPQAPPSQTNGHLDRDRLIKAVLPNGVPPKSEAIVRLNAWLDEAEAISKLR